MKKYIFWMIVFTVGGWAGCSDDRGEDLSPSYADREWYRLEDSDVPADHALYELYRKYGVPVFYNDTIGSEERGLSRDGKKVIHYEVIDIDYWIVSRTSASVDYVLNASYRTDKADIEEAADFMEKYVFPSLKKSRYPMSFLLLDSIINKLSDVRGRHALPTYYAMTTTLIAGIHQLKTMNEAEKKLMAGYVMSELYVYDIKNSTTYMDLFAPFFEVSVGSTGNSLYGVVRGKSSGSYYQTSYLLPAKDWLEYGFLRYNPKNMVYLLASRENNKIVQNYDLSTIDTHLVGYTFPVREQDLYEYIAHVLAGDDTGFQAAYGAYPKVLQKYGLMKTLLQEYLKQTE